ncbi:Uncharacterized conserved protein, DUF2249 family [Paracoccus aminovorans]|uniref:Uncharacterized conserved protein, DUF2249 family n=1 Tax=Paracoccus aminovorans TaxID=34004 RepID=A0A1I3AAX8_9RHOB|nr:DUF2249 domain-containing protein [Paracoccus aminovorans]SFH46889.1 Uncharacterized conserved protein, DUF2249 family [Paracoccus aminovorans]
MTEIVTLDVRPLLARGDEPLAAIMAAADALTPGQSLRLLAPFRPVPLFRVMERRGYQHRETPLGGSDWQIDFSRAEQALSQGSTLEAFSWPEPSAFLDLTALPSAEAAARLATAMLGVAAGDVVFALLGEEPAALLPALDAAGHQWAGNHAADGSGYRLLIRRGDA